MADVTIGDNQYRTAKMNAKAQFHVMRRLLPLIAGLASPPGAEGRPLQLNDMLSAVSQALSQMSDADCNYVLGECLKVCRRKQGDNWLPVWNTAAGELQFQDIDLPGMMTLTMATLEENLGSFLPALPSTSPNGNQVPNVQ